MLQILLVGLGGFLGAILRYGVSLGMHRLVPGGFPIGTLVVNVIGCAALGFFAGMADGRLVESPNLRMFVGVGVLGAFTTFSTFGYETIESLRAGDWHHSLISVTLNLVVGLAAVIVARRLAEGVGAG